MLAVLGERINSVRVLPKRLVDRGHPEDGAWGRWARFVLRRPVPVAAVGLAIVAVLVCLGIQLNADEAQLKNFPGTGDGDRGPRRRSPRPGSRPGVMKPLDVLVENGGDPEAVAERLRARATASPARRRAEGLARGRRGARRGVPRDRRRRSGHPGDHRPLRTRRWTGPDATVSGTAAVDRDFVHAIYGNFPYLLAFVLALTFILLARAFRSIVLPLKAVLLNLVSLAAAFGIVVFVFQLGHGSAALGDRRDAGDHRLDPDDDLRLPVRPLDGLRGLHAHAHARGLRRDRLHRRRRSSSASPAPASS